jgi:hypothetical protein
MLQAEPVVATNIMVPGAVVAGLVWYGVREWVKTVREDAKASKAEREQISNTMSTMATSITRVTDALTGFDGKGGLIARVEEVKAQADRALDRANVVGKHVLRLDNRLADLQNRGEHRDSWIKVASEVDNMPAYQPIPARTITNEEDI